MEYKKGLYQTFVVEVSIWLAVSEPALLAPPAVLAPADLSLSILMNARVFCIDSWRFLPTYTDRNKKA